MTRKLLFSSILSIAFLGLAPKPYAATVPVVSVDDDAAYAAGTQAMNERRWSDAIVSFDQVINAKGKKADAALYWKAYALNKLDKQDLASDTCAQLRTQFKDSAWNEDCRALSLTIRVHNHVTDRVDANVQVMDLRAMDRAGQKDPEAEIKLLALNAVMRENPTQGIPLMRGILSGDQPASVKQQALFILAQNHSPEAQAMMHELIVGKMGPELQYKAIQDSGIYRGKRNSQGGKDSSDELLEAYRTSSDVKVKRAVISALFISGDDARLVDLARQEKDLELKRTIVSQLSLMKGKAASDYMMELLK